MYKIFTGGTAVKYGIGRIIIVQKERFPVINAVAQTAHVYVGMRADGRFQFGRRTDFHHIMTCIQQVFFDDMIRVAAYINFAHGIIIHETLLFL